MQMPRVVDIHKKKGVRKKFDIYIGRSVKYTEFTRNSKWANLFYDKLDAYEKFIRETILWDQLGELEGKILGCWCLNTTEIEPIKCHGQILMKLFREKYL